MKLPRISVGVLMAIMVVIALDCVIYRSINTRPDDVGLTSILFGTLPMANLLAIGLAWLASGRARHRQFLVGFQIGGWCLLLTSIFWREPMMDLITKAFYAVGFTSLFGCTFIFTVLEEEVSIGDVIASYGYVIIVPFLFEILIGLIVGAIASRFGRTSDPGPEAAPASAPIPIRSLVVLIVLVAIPAAAVEGVLRRKVDATTARLVEGSEARVDVGDPTDLAGILPMVQLDKAKVRIEEDRGPNQIDEFLVGWINSIRDHRMVKVNVLDGPMAGQSIDMIYFMLQPIQ